MRQINGCVNIRSKSRLAMTRTSAIDRFHCRQFRYVVADPSTADLDSRCSARLAEPAGCPRAVSRRRLAAVDRSTAFRCRRRHRLPIRRLGGAARKIHWPETPSRDYFDCASAASTSEVDCQVLMRLEKTASTRTVTLMNSLLNNNHRNQ